MAQEFLDFIQGPARVQDITGESMPQGVRNHSLAQPRPLTQCREQFVDRSRFHRRADRRPEQVDEHEVAHRRAVHPGSLQHILVVGLDHQAVHRHRA